MNSFQIHSKYKQIFAYFLTFEWISKFIQNTDKSLLIWKLFAGSKIEIHLL